MQFKTGRAIVAAALLLLACGDDSSGPGGQPSSLVLQNNPPATAPVGSQLQLAVIVRDENGNAMANQPLTFTPSVGSTITNFPTKTIKGPTPIGTWTLSGNVGPNTLTITSGSLSLTVTVNGTAGEPAAIEVVQGDNQTALAGTTLPTNVQVKVTDEFGNAIPGQPVQFRAEGGGLLGGNTTANATTDANGVATAPAWTLGKVNITQQIVVTSGTLSRNVTARIQAIDIDGGFSATSVPRIARCFAQQRSA